MSRTKRIYNRILKKAQRVHLDDTITNEFGIVITSYTGIPYTRRSYICMGRCPMCRDHNKEQKLIRKRRKEQFRLEEKKYIRNVNIETDCNIETDANIETDCNSCPDLHIIDYDDAFCRFCR